METFKKGYILKTKMSNNSQKCLNYFLNKKSQLHKMEWKRVNTLLVKSDVWLIKRSITRPGPCTFKVC